jgi:hypothetical protein
LNSFTISISRAMRTQKRHRQVHARKRRILHHDGQADLAHAGELFECLVGRAAQGRAMIGRHHSADLAQEAQAASSARPATAARASGG